jgi:hypothetical protein
MTSKQAPNVSMKRTEQVYGTLDREGILWQFRTVAINHVLI